MVPYSQIDINAPFSEAFTSVLTMDPASGTAKRVFLHVASRIVSLGALTGAVYSHELGSNPRDECLAMRGDGQAHAVSGR